MAVLVKSSSATLVVVCRLHLRILSSLKRLFLQLLDGGSTGSDYVEAFLSSYVEKKKLDSGLVRTLKNQVS